MIPCHIVYKNSNIVLAYCIVICLYCLLEVCDDTNTILSNNIYVLIFLVFIVLVTYTIIIIIIIIYIYNYYYYNNYDYYN